MRLRRLDLIRYGHFEGQSLDFGPAGRPCDVTVVYGPNEAGKSTAFAAWLDLLYGFPARNAPYAFRFDRKDLLVGAEIDVGGETLTLRRLPKKTGSLIDAEGRALPDNLRTAYLHGLDREAYRTRFSLNDAVLRDGGEEIAKAQGDLGQLLHAGRSGLSGLSRLLDGIEDEVGAFYKKSGSAQVLPTLKRRLKDLDAEIRARRLAPLQYDTLLGAQQDRRVDADAARDDLNEARRTQAHAQAAATRRALAAEGDEIKRRLSDYPGGPDLPPDAATEIASLCAQAQSAARRKDEAEHAREDARVQLDALSPDAAGLDLGPVLAEIEGLTFDGGSLSNRAALAEEDLDRRRMARETLLLEAETLSQAVTGQPLRRDLAGLEGERLDRLDGALRSLEAAQVEARAAAETLAEAREEHGDAPPAPRGMEALADAIEAFQCDAPDLPALREAAAEAEQALHRAERDLPAEWRDSLAQTGGPPEEDTLAAALATAERLRATRADAQSRLSQARRVLDDAQARLDAARDNPAAVDTQTLQHLRARREAAWAAHVATLNAASAETFEAALRADDAATAAHAAGSEARAALATRVEALALAQVEERDAARALDTTETLEAEAVAAQAALCARLGLGPDTPPSEIRARRSALVAALDAVKQHATAQARVDRAAGRHAALEAALARALEQSGAVAQGALAPTARRRLEQFRAEASARQIWEERAVRIERLAARAGRLQQVADRARTDLDEIATGSWAEDQTPQAIRAALPRSRRLADRLEEIARLDQRIGKMEEALAAFDRAARLPREVVGPQDSADALIRAAAERNRAAEETARRMADLAKAQQDAGETARVARDDEAAARDRIAALLAGQTVDAGADPAELARRLAARDGLRAELTRIEAEIAKAALDMDPDRLAEEEARDDPARLPALTDAVTRAETAAEDANRALGAAEQALRAALDGDGAVRADQERAVVLEDLRAAAREAVARQIGLSAARAALRRLGEDRRGPMLRDTQAAFAALTDGAWSRLDTWADGQGERLVGVTGESFVGADEMSTGTRAQLYLSLRLAGHAAFVREAGPLPFVTDDILETFDDDRAAAALDLTAQLGERGQAILFTHHAHLVDLAQQRIPDVRVIEMPPRG